MDKCCPCIPLQPQIIHNGGCAHWQMLISHQEPHQCGFELFSARACFCVCVCACMWPCACVYLLFSKTLVDKPAGYSQQIWLLEKNDQIILQHFKPLGPFSGSTFAPRVLHKARSCNCLQFLPPLSFFILKRAQSQSFVFFYARNCKGIILWLEAVNKW